jgi:hypothetical protein
MPMMKFLHSTDTNDKVFVILGIALMPMMKFLHSTDTKDDRTDTNDKVFVGLSMGESSDHLNLAKS